VTNITSKNKVVIPKEEYMRLKSLDKLLGGFLAYTEYVADIREARKDVKNKKVISQEKLFRQLGF